MKQATLLDRPGWRATDDGGPEIPTFGGVPDFFETLDLAADSSGEHPELSVILITRNGGGRAHACLESVLRQADADFELIVVDNASTDDTLERLRTSFPELRAIELECDLGYGGAANVGVGRALGRYCLILDQDLILVSPLSPAIDRLDADPRLAILGCRLHGRDGRLQYTIGHEPTPRRMILSWIVPPALPWIGPRCARARTRDRDYESVQRGVAWVGGAFLLCRREVWHELGGMDPALSRSVEDVDLCRRVRDAGYRVDFDPGIDALRHAAEVPGDGSAGGARALRRTLRNNVRYCAKHYGRGWALLVRLALGPICLLRAAGLFLRGLLPGANTCLHRARVFAELGAALLSGGPGAGLLRQAPTTPSASAHSTRGARPDREPATLEEPGGSGGSGGEPGL